MSGSLLEIKKKIGGVQNTRKITKAMQLVAASKMRQFQKKAVASRGFAWDLFKILKRNLAESSQSVFTEKRESGKILFVIYTSDKGLCGPLNNKLLNGLFRSERWKNLKENERALITIGKKAHTFAQNNKIPELEHFIGIPEKLTSLDAIDVMDKILTHWKTGDIKEVVFMAPHYKNSFTFYPVMKTFLPFSADAIKSNLHIQEDEDTHTKEEENEDGNNSMLFAPDAQQVLEKLYEQIIQAMFIQSFLELKASEYSSRMMAMQSATDAADRITGDLKRVYNKARQSAITQEIAELIGASMALED